MVRILNLQQGRNIQESVLLYLKKGLILLKVEEDDQELCRIILQIMIQHVHFISEDELKEEAQWNPTWWFCNPFR